MSQIVTLTAVATLSATGDASAALQQAINGLERRVQGAIQAGTAHVVGALTLQPAVGSSVTAEIGSAVSLPGNIALTATPGSVELQAASTNTTGIFSIEQQITVGGAPTLVTDTSVEISGLTLDGNAASIASTHPLLVAYVAGDLTLTNDTFQNALGIGALFSETGNTTLSGDSFVNIGQEGIIKSGAVDPGGTQNAFEGVAFGESSLTGREGLAFVGTNVTDGTGNAVSNCSFTDVGLDAISATNQSDFTASANTIVNAVATLDGTTISPVPITAWATEPAASAGVYLYEDANSTVIGNTIDGVSGNGLDIDYALGLTLAANAVTGSGSAGIAIANAQDAMVASNIGDNNAVLAPHFAYDGGLTLAQWDVVSDPSMIVAGNTFENMGTGTSQVYGIQDWQGESTRNIQFQNNLLVANSGGAVSPGMVYNTVAEMSMEPSSLVDPPSGATLTLDGGANAVAFLTEMSVGTLTVDAGSAGSTDVLFFLNSGISLSSGFTLNADVAGSEVDLAGGDTLIDDGAVTLAGARMVVDPLLEGHGTFTLGAGSTLWLPHFATIAATTDLAVDLDGPSLLQWGGGVGWGTGDVEPAGTLSGSGASFVALGASGGDRITLAGSNDSLYVSSTPALPLVVVASGADASVSIACPGNIENSGVGNMITAADSSQITVDGSAGTVSAGNATTISLGGTSNVVTLGSDDTITLAGVNETVSAARAVVAMDAGASAIFNGDSNAIVGAGADTLTVIGSDNVATLAGGTIGVMATITDNGSGDRITTGGGSNLVINGTGNDDSNGLGSNTWLEGSVNRASIGTGGMEIGGTNDTGMAASGSSVWIDGQANAFVAASGAVSLTIFDRGSYESVNVGADSTLTDSGSFNTDATASSSQVIISGYDDTVNAGSGSNVSLEDATSISITNGVVVTGTHDTVFLGNGAGFASATLTDNATALTVQVASSGADLFQNLASDPSFLVVLSNGIGGYDSVSAALAAVTSDGAGGASLPLGSGGTIDFRDLAPSALHAANFRIG